MPTSTDGNLDGNTGAESEHIFVVKYIGILTGIFQALVPENLQSCALAIQLIIHQYAIEQIALVACRVPFADAIEFKDFLTDLCEPHAP